MQIKKTVIKNVFYVLLVVLYSYYLTTVKFSSPISPVVEFIIQGENLEQQSGQIYCHSQDNKYSRKRRLEFSYNQANKIGAGLYKIQWVLPCSNKVTSLRLDPLSDSGSVYLKSFRVYGNVWRDINLKELLVDIKPLSNVAKLDYTDEAILMQLSGNDPYLEITSELQSYFAPPPSRFYSSLFKNVIKFFILLKVFLFLSNILLKNGQVISGKITRAKLKMDEYIEKAICNVLSGFKKTIKVNIILVLLSFVLYLIANMQFFNHLFPLSQTKNFSLLLAFMLFYILPAAAYVVLLKLIGKKLFLRILLGFLFILFYIVFLLDVNLFTLNGMHVFHGISMLFDGGIQNFGKNLAFTKLSWSELYLYLAIMALSFIFCWVLAWICETKYQKLCLHLSIRTTLLTLLLSLTVVFIIQKSIKDSLSPQKFNTIEAGHMLYMPMVGHKNYILEYNIVTKPMYDTHRSMQDIKISYAKTDVENIYIFIFESLREDIVNAQTMPFLNEFKQNSWSFSRALASGNATHYAWYAIINGRNPYYWERYNNSKNKKGSPLLQIFKQAGYKINVYTAKDLSYLNSNKVLFGENLSIPAFILDHPKLLSPPEHDKRTIDKLLADLDTHQSEKNLNLIFLDSSHYPYKWAEGDIKELTPYIGTPEKGVGLNKAKQLIKKDKQQIFNRYKNSNKFSDKLFGQAINAIKQTQLIDKSLIVAVGDHGQQFLEHGYLLHGFSLHSEDIHVPLYFQGVNISPRIDQQTVTHLDILPTLLELSGIQIEQNIYDGVSMLAGKQKYGLSAAAGMQNTPYSFIIENSDYKLTFRIEKNNPVNSKKLFVDAIYKQDGSVFIPNNGETNDYLQFVSEQFPGFPYELNFLQKN